MQGAACLTGAAAGLGLARWLLARNSLLEPINLFYLTLLGLLCGYLFSPPLVRGAHDLKRALGRVPPGAILAAGIGATFALFITVLLNSVLERVPGFSWQLSLLLTSFLIGVSSWFFVSNRAFFVPHLLAQPQRLPAADAARTSIIDTSAIIDGRVAEVAEANFLSGTLLLPRYVLVELQHIADSDETARRKRGRRGLEVLERLKTLPGLHLEVIGDDFEGVTEVDAKLVALCRARRAALITTDYNLSRVAGLEGVRVLNLHALAGALKSNLIAGETLPLQIVKAGREPGQGLAYLDDGTLVVVEGAADQIGRTVGATVTSSLQTSVGRMIFAKLGE